MLSARDVTHSVHASRTLGNERSEMSRSGWLDAMQGEVIPPVGVEVTCTSGKGRIIDYAIVPFVCRHLEASEGPWRRRFTRRFVHADRFGTRARLLFIRAVECRIAARARVMHLLGPAIGQRHTPFACFGHFGAPSWVPSTAAARSVGATSSASARSAQSSVGAPPTPLKARRLP